MSKNYRVLVVDDERIILEGLVHTYPWEKAGFSVCGTALSGEGALEQCRLLRPDVVMTDIRMKAMDGLELIRKIKGELPQTEFVVISAFRDFEYAQTACSLDVFSYLLKPFSDEDFLQVMTALRTYLEKKEQQNQAVRLFEQHREELLSLQLKKFLLGNTGHLAQKLSELMPEWNQSTSFACICVDIDQTVAYLLQEDRAVYRYLQLQVFLDAVKPRLSCVAAELPDQRMLLVAFDCGPEGVHKILEQTMEELEKQGYVNCYYVAHGQCLSGYEGMRQSFRQAMIGMELAYEGENLMEYRTGVSQKAEQAVYPKEQEEKILAVLRSGAMDQLEEAIDEFGKNLEQAGASGPFIRLCFQQLGLSLQFWLVQFLEPDEKSLQAYMDFLFSLNTVRPEQLRKVMAVMIQSLAEQAGTSREKGGESGRQYVEQAVEYVQHHLENPQLTVADAAEALHLNPVYFGRIFKRERSQSFREYLLQQRIQKACGLLRSTGLSVTEVALSVGMENLSYFSSQFKKQMGVLPSEYRR